MTNFKTLEDVFEDYGMAVYKNRKSVEPIASLWDVFDSKKITNELFLKDSYTDKDYSEKQYLKDLIGHLTTFDFYPRIIDLPKWMTAFNVDTNPLPFPENYLKDFSFVLFEPDGSENNLVVPFVEIDDVAEIVNKTKKQVFAELFPPFVMTRLFNPNKATLDARINFHIRLDQLDSLLDIKCVEQFKEDLLKVVISILKTQLIEKERFLTTS